MAASLGPNLIENGLILALDAADKNSCLPSSLINMSTWTVGIGGATNYNQNGNPSTENERFLNTNPWGQTDIIWGSFPSGNDNDDGGWNTTDFNIDNTKLYRFSVWVKRTSSTSGGTFYFGMYASGDGSRRMDNSAVEGNAYWNCTGTSGLTQDVWYLYVGHVYPFNTSHTGRHPDTGYYFVNNPTKQGEVNGCNIGTGDLKWSSNSTTGIHRTYHYYCGDSTTRLQFYDPRVDLVDGKQPNINELVSRSPIQWTDLSGNNYNGTLTNGPTFNTNNGGNIVFDATDDFVNVGNIGTITNFTVLVWCYPTNVTDFRNILDCNFNYNATTGNIGPRLEMNSSAQLTWIYSNITNSNESWYGHTVLNTGFNANSWYCIGITYNSTGNTSITYHNGLATGFSRSSIGSPTGFIGTMNNVILGKGFFLDGTRLYAGRLSNTLIYNRALSAAEILQNYNATKTRFGL